ncbi:MAG TPA: hypothetical protein PLO74_06315, partial [Thermotogota bacterium]|nr:hypothetical protein [Thermotogota bacterium]
MVFFGLGNPGTEYHDSKHNLGFQAIDQFVITHRKEILESRFLPMLYHYWSCKDRFGNAYLLIKPLTYMNNSGEAYRRAQKQFGYADGESVIIYDDVALPLGAVRIRARGSDGPITCKITTSFKPGSSLMHSRTFWEYLEKSVGNRT